MAYIESHQDLRSHPKVKRLARILDVHKAQAIGHLQMLWWWALDHAFDGDCRSFDAFDLSDAAEWDGDPDTFVKALMECGPGEEDGFLDADWSLHSWRKYTEALAASRAGASLGNHKRWHASRGIVNPDCPHCDIAPESGVTSPPTLTPNRKPSGGESTDLPNLPTYQEPTPLPQRSARKRATQLPDGWEPNDAHRALASQERVNCDREAGKFRDHAAAQGRTAKDWDAAFRNWIKRAADFGAKTTTQRDDAQQVIV